MVHEVVGEVEMEEIIQTSDEYLRGSQHTFHSGLYGSGTRYDATMVHVCSCCSTAVSGKYLNGSCLATFCLIFILSLKS